MSEADQITQWLELIKQGDQTAAQQLFDRYFPDLIRLARRRLAGMPRRSVDEEDVALSAMASLYRGLANERFQQLDDRDDLWKLLVTITARKAWGKLRHEKAEKRGGGQVRGESVFVRSTDGDRAAGIGEQADAAQTPDVTAVMAEDCERLLLALPDDTLRQVATLKLEGYDATEIASQLGCVRETVQRKLRLIREIWSSSIDS